MLYVPQSPRPRTLFMHHSDCTMHVSLQAHHRERRPGCCSETGGRWSSTDVGESTRLALKTCSPVCPLLLDLHLCRCTIYQLGVVLLRRIHRMWERGRAQGARSSQAQSR